MSTREQLLFALESAAKEGKDVSGEELAAKLGLSRVAVWKAAKALQDEGVLLQTKKGRGYRLDGDCRLLSSGRIRAHLPAALCDMEVFTYPLTDSTNRRAKDYADVCVSRALFCAEEQSAGRGRLGRSFYSPPGTGLYLSYLFSSALPLEKLTAVTPCAAVVTARAIEKVAGVRGVGIKWVNDLYFGGKKVCGILTEAISSLEHGGENKIVVGVGINLSTEDFPPDLAIAGSLGVLPNRCALAAEIAAGLYEFERNPEDRAFMREYTERSVVLGKAVRLFSPAGEIDGVVSGFDENGGLLLNVGKEKPRLYTGGEITLRLAQSD